jgi:CHAT domain-containing protein
VICGLAALAALSALSALTSARTLPDGTSPRSRPIERRIARGGHHRYQLQLSAGEFVHLSIEQKSADVLVQVRDPGGHVIGDFDDQPAVRDVEEIDVVADVTGVYTFTISTSSSATGGGSYVVRVGNRRAATDADRAMQQSRRLRTDAAHLTDVGRFDEARSLLERAMNVSTRVRGANDRDVGLLSLQLAYNALAMRDDARARWFAARAAEIFTASGGHDDLFAVRARSLFAVLHQHAGEGAQAEALLQQSLAVFERTLGPNHPWSVECLTTQANVRFDAGDIDAAEALNRRAMALLDAGGDTHGIAYAALLNNLGEVYWRRGDNAQAEALFLQSLAAAEKLEGARSYRVTTTLQDLGIVARQRGDYAKALEYDTRALFMREELLGPDHADIAPLLNNLAVLYRTRGDETHALPMLFRALAIRERTVGPYHLGTLNTVGNIARSYASIGDAAHAVEFERRANAIVEKQLELNLAVGSERQKLAFVRSVADRTDRAISLHLNRAHDDPDAAALAALVLLQRKGRVQDAMADVFGAVRSRVTHSNDRVDMDRLNDTRRRLAQLALDGAGGTDAKRQQTLAALEAETERLESSLSAHSAEYRTQAQSVTLAAVQDALPPDAALIEYAVFRPFHPDAPQRTAEYDPPRYAAYVIRRGGVPAGFDLGDARTIERAVEAMRDAVRDSTRHEADVKARAAALFDLIMRPLAASVDGAARLVISPDGHLNLVPFEALVGDRGRYVIELYATSYVTSGRDLLRMRGPRGVPGDPVIVADPRFGEPASTVRRTVGPTSAVRQSVTSGTTLSTAYFSPLAATGSEARAIKALFPEARLLTGAAATKENVRRVRAPRILHIASHAFFLDDLQGGAAAGREANPLLRSGVALAGANTTAAGHSNGVLTALEASGLDLWGTELVTLSACDTGVGEIRNGEGVYGLRRAFVLAGAQSLVMSLWPVSDYVARDTMVAYYAALRAGLGRGDALRQVKLAMLQRASRRHPYYWAGFIQSGEWGRLGAAARPTR